MIRTTRRLIAITFLVCLVSLLNSQGAEALFQCETRQNDTCGSNETLLLRMNSTVGADAPNNSHAQLANYTTGNYSWSVCCWADTFRNMDNYCDGDFTRVLGLESTTSSHVQNGSNTSYPYGACLNMTGTLTCDYPNSACGTGYTGLASMASSEVNDNNLTNAHLGTYDLYLRKVCCSLGNTPPVVDSLIVNSTFGLNRTSENLTAYVTASDSDQDNVSLNIDWRVNGTSIAVLNMNFDVNDSAGAGKTRDYSSFGNNGTEAGSIVWNASGGWNGTGAYEFDGDNDYLNLGDDTDFEFTGPVSMSAWVWLDELPSTDGIHDAIVGKYNAGNNNRSWGWFFSKSDGMSFFKSPDGTSSNGQSISTNITFGAGDVNRWMHVVVNIDTGGYLAFYVDGQPSGNGTFTNTTYHAGTATVFIGAVNRSGSIPDWEFKGRIDNLLILNRSISAEQVVALYNNRTDLIVSQETTVAENWTACVVPNDGIDDGTQVCSAGLIIENSPPEIISLVVNSTFGTNRSWENLTAYPSMSDDDNDAINVNYDWRVNDTSIAIINMNFDVNDSAGVNKTRDYSMFGNNATLLNETTWLASGGWNGTGALGLDGIDDRVRVPDDDSQTLGNGTLAAWVYLKETDTAGGGIVAKVAGSSGGLSAYSYALFYDFSSNDRLTLILTSGGSAPFDVHNCDDAATLNEWQHVAATWDGTNIRIYIDGNECSGYTYLSGDDDGQDATPGDTTHPVWIGYFDGVTTNATIDNVLVLNRTLSAEQILALYNNRSDLIVSQETSGRNNWTACLTPNDGLADGTTTCSTPNLMIASPPDPVSLLYPTDGNTSVFERYVNFNWTDAVEYDGDQVNYTLNLTVEAGACSVSTEQSNIQQSNLTYGDLCTDQRYWWNITACDVDGCSSVSETFNFTIASVVSIKLIENLTELGAFQRNETKATDADNIPPFIVENQGNVEVNLTVNATNEPFIDVSMPDTAYQFKAGVNETGAFNTTGSQTTYTPFDAIYQNLIKQLHYNDSIDAARIDINITMPFNEPPGQKQGNITVLGVAS